jgi:hypothetical protein
MTHPDPQAAPPETDLRAMSTWRNLRLVTEHSRMARISILRAYDVEPEGLSSLTKHLTTNEAVEIHTAIGEELTRRLARPERLRERVMAAIDAWGELDGQYVPEHTYDSLKAAVAAVLEGENA